MSTNQNGKGSRYRPRTVDQNTWDNNWNKIFRKTKKISNKKNGYNNKI